MNYNNLDNVTIRVQGDPAEAIISRHRDTFAIHIPNDAINI